MQNEFRFAALILVGIAVIIYSLQPFLPMQELVLKSSEVVQKPWMIFTHIFLHGSPSHLLGNMFALGLFGSILERLIGWKRFLLVFFIGGLVSSLGDVFFYSSTLGASGAVFGVLGALAVLRPKMSVPAFGTILPMFLAAILWILFDLTGFLYPDGIAHAAHLFGMAAGGLLGLWLRNIFPSEKRPAKETISYREHRKWENKWMGNCFTRKLLFPSFVHL